MNKRLRAGCRSIALFGPSGSGVAPRAQGHLSSRGCAHGRLSSGRRPILDHERASEAEVSAWRRLSGRTACKAAPPLEPCVVAQDAEEHGREERPHQDDDEPRKRNRAEEAVVPVIRRPLAEDSVCGRRRRREEGGLAGARRRPRVERRRRWRRRQRAVEPSVDLLPEEARVGLVIGAAGAVALAPLADRHVRPALGFGDHRPERAVGHEDQAVPALGPRVAALARRGHGRRG